MDSLLAAIMTKISGSALSTAAGGRIFLDQAPENSEFPYIVFFVVSGVPADTFTDAITETVIQFSIFSTSLSVVEMTGIYANLRSLFDDCSLSITGDTHLWMEWQNLTTMVEDLTTPSGTSMVRHWAVDYSILVKD